jgi:CPA2 family monovalent cation:H+ antiporter-2
MVRTLAELGVILLMFSIGLEFSIKKLLQVGGPAGIAAITETSVMFGLGYLAGQLMGLTSTESLFLGAIVAISSTTIIVKAFAEHGDPRARGGHRARDPHRRGSHRDSAHRHSHGRG